MAKRVLRYFALRNDVGDSTRVTLTCFTDADYANDDVDRKSISGYVTMLDGNVVSYASRKQEINAQSTTEAEYVAMNEGIKDLLWILGLCGVAMRRPVLFGDNRGSIYLAAKPEKHSKTKHIESKYSSCPASS
ncbi:LOW QUALITY PROTEIN: hypothetical protein PHMEG_00012254 [Phytophthora megakarya]|uniref:Polyprotein n=1 Tax=Phytophthora megakarya TaxID=4795 RepID=A0A225W9N3_9STRA|nr:LOW QUALITY PROTEIN: hypothetical protein PHMEG_00012254 [Phytophthora megakarya]